MVLVTAVEVEGKTNRLGRWVLDNLAGRRRTGTVIVRRVGFSVVVLFGWIVVVILVVRVCMAIFGRLVLKLVLRVVVLVG